MKNRFGFPNLGFGMGLRTPHYQTILSQKPKIDWFEIISENFMETKGRPRHILEQIRQHYPIVTHGVAMSVGSPNPLNVDYLKKLKKFAEEIEAPWVSDHICWTGVHSYNTHDLLPIPFTEETLRHMVKRIKQVQDILERPLVLENPSTYVEFLDDNLPEWEFLARMSEEADCGLLLDVNNVYVNSYNHGFDPRSYIDAIPKDRVVQIHLAGHTNKGTHIIDTHDDFVIDAVWDIYRYLYPKVDVSVMVEWDQKIPPFEVVEGEVKKAREYVTIAVESIDEVAESK